VPQVFEDPQVRHRGMLMHLPHPSGVAVPQVGSPMRFGGDAVVSRQPPPTLGQHSDEILHMLGYDAARIAQLRQAGVI
jgi:crotonobetainyl-CoA:carnitine CoA-transferase CaiB-like acyl-CoA transferase